VVPLVGFAVTYRVCRELQARTDAPRPRAVRLRRTPSGGFEEAGDE